MQLIAYRFDDDCPCTTAARANIKRHVKRLFRKYGYPPDLQDVAMQNVLQQAEASEAEWV